MEEKNKKNRILIIDSDEMMRIYFRDIFWIHGRSREYEILMASSLDDAEKIIFDKETRPDTVFLDIITLSKKSYLSAFDISRSVDFVSKIKNNKELSVIKIILYSSHKENILKNNLLKTGIDGILVKGENTPREIIAFADKIHGTRTNN
jgi:DNA-binding NarL/FixJ family response regulator